MIQLTRLNGDSFILNVLYIEQVQSFPDTTITLTNNKKFVVRESETEVVLRVNQYYQSIGIQRCLPETGELNER